MGRPASGWRRWLRTLDTLRPALLVTWAVPAERVRPRIPRSLRLDTVLGPDGGEWAFLSVAAVRNVDARAAAFPLLRLTFEQANYRTYVTHEGRPGVFFFGHFLNSRLALIPPLLVTPNAFLASGSLKYSWRRRNGLPTSWRVRFALRGNVGATLFDASGDFTPAGLPLLGEQGRAASFITHRLDGYYASRRGGIGRLSVDHAEMEPWGGKLREVRADPWISWKLLSAPEIAAPAAVMLQHEIHFSGEAPVWVAG